MTLSQTEKLPDDSRASQFNRASFLFFAIVAALFVAGRLWRLSSSCLWFDEIFSVHAARYGWAEMLKFVAADIIHPPLFYVLLKLWIGIGGESTLWLRLLPAIFSMATIYPFVLLGREIRLKPAETNFAFLLMAVNGYLIKYAQEVRMYSLLLLLSVCSIWFFVRLLNRDTRTGAQLGALCALNLLLVYTHYAGWCLVAVEAAIVIIWKRGKLKSFLLTVVTLVLAYVPWIYLVRISTEPGKGLAQNIGWVTRPRLYDLLQLFVLLNRPFLFSQSTVDLVYFRLNAVLAGLLIGLSLLLFAWRTFKPGHMGDQWPARSIRLLFLFSFTPVVLIFVLSWTLPYSIWGTRHLIIVACPFSILVALAVMRLQPYWIRITVFLLIGCWLLVSGTVYLLQPPPTFIWCAWGNLAQELRHIEPHSEQTVSVYAYEDLVAYHLWFALDDTERQRFNVAVVKGVPGLTEDPAYFLPRRFNDVSTLNALPLNEQRVWIVFRAARWDETRPPLNGLTNAGYRVGHTRSIELQGQQAFLVELRRN